MKTLFLDIETSPNIAHVWGLFKQTVSLAQLQLASEIICYAYSWNDNDAVSVVSSKTYDPAGVPFEQMLQHLYKLLDEADAVCHYNGRSFDIPIINKEFVKLNWKPYSQFVNIDLKETVKKQFRFTSHKLQHIAEELNIGSKLEHEGHELWVKCIAGQEDAWNRMKEYNMQDVVLLKRLYKRLSGWIYRHPNINLYEHTPEQGKLCPTCGTKLHKRGVYVTTVSTYQRYVCPACGTNSRDRLNLTDRTDLVIPVVNQ